jgi:hypothetical protein
MLESLQRCELPHRNCGILRQPTSTRPALWIVEEDAQRAVVKDFTPNGFIYKHLVGRFLVWRESKAYRRLRGLRGIPPFYGVIDGLALVTGAIAGRSVEGLENEQKLSESFFEELRKLVEAVHSRGLAHCDLKRAPNVLQGDDGRPYIVDWSAAISQTEFRIYPLNLIYRRFVLDDLNGILKLQLRHCPEHVMPDEKKRYQQRSRGEELLRALRDRLRTLLQRMA